MAKRKGTAILLIVLFAAGVATGVLLVKYFGDRVSRPADTVRKAADVAVNAAEDGAVSSTAAEAETEPQPALPAVSIAPAKTKSIKTEAYTNGLFSMDVPEGWTVAPVGNADPVHYAFFVYDPASPDHMIYVSLKTEGFLKTEAMRDWFAGYFPDNASAVLPYIDPQTTENFFLNWNAFVGVQPAGSFPPATPSVNGFTVIESLGENAFGGETLHAAFQNAGGKTVEGIFTCTLREEDKNYATQINVYHTLFITAPGGELPQWADLLARCAATLTFSSEFVRGFNGAEEILSDAVRADAEVYGETVRLMLRGWETRRSDHDILNQKQSDADLGYERVYDTVSGEIYRAPAGFMQQEWNGRYLPVTDEMYNLPIDGYIQLGS